jgi:hypothetical protein
MPIRGREVPLLQGFRVEGARRIRAADLLGAIPRRLRRRSDARDRSIRIATRFRAPVELAAIRPTVRNEAIASMAINPLSRAVNGI